MKTVDQSRTLFRADIRVLWAPRHVQYHLEYLRLLGGRCLCERADGRHSVFNQLIRPTMSNLTILANSSASALLVPKQNRQRFQSSRDCPQEYKCGADGRGFFEAAHSL